MNGKKTEGLVKYWSFFFIKEQYTMKICGVDVCISSANNWRITCKKCPHYVDADKIINYLVDELRSETGIDYSEILKTKFCYEKRGILNDD